MPCFNEAVAPSPCLVCALLFLAQAADSPESALARIRSRVAVSPLTGDLTTVAGKYTSTPPDLGSGLSGEYLHLLPDGTYIYCEWADVEPLTILDKGTWRLSGPTVELSSDSDITWRPLHGCCSPLERQFLLFQRDDRKRDAILMGMGYALSYFEEQAKDDPRLMLLITGLTRAETYNQKSTARVKARLMKEAWRPEYFKPKP
jgi:hypothetical protein